MRGATIYRAVACFFSGILLSLAFAPYQISVLSILCPALLFYCWHDQKHWRLNALLGFLFGLGLFGSGVYWVFISVHEYGHLDTALALVVTALFVIVLSCFFMLQGAVTSWLFPKTSRLKIIIVMPALWVIFEWLRANLFSGFPWLLLGSAHTDSLLRAYLPLSGVYGVSLITTFLAGLLAASWQAFRTKNVTFRMILISTVLLSIIINVAFFLRNIHWSSPKAHPLSVALIQGNIPQVEKWDPNRLSTILEHYVTLTTENKNHDLIVWPEGAIPLVKSNATSLLAEFSDFARENHTTILSGLAFDVDGDPDHYYNGLIALGKTSGQYFKRHLVPFGEYLPWPWLATLIKRLEIPMSTFLPGDFAQAPIKLNGVKLSSYLCYEIAYSEEVIETLNDANIIVNISDDSWFGHSTAAAQQFQLARVRALETGRPVLATSNSGITGIIDEQGRVKKQIPAYISAVASGVVQGMQGTTPLMQYHVTTLLPWGLIILLLICWIFLVGWIREKRP